MLPQVAVQQELKDSVNESSRLHKSNEAAERQLTEQQELLVTNQQVHSHSLSYSYSHTLPITCTYCYDEIKGTQDQIYSHADSLTHSLTAAVTLLTRCDRPLAYLLHSSLKLTPTFDRQVIGWLNKEVSEVQMRRAGYSSSSSNRQRSLAPTISRPSTTMTEVDGSVHRGLAAGSRSNVPTITTATSNIPSVSSSARVSQARAATAMLLNSSSMLAAPGKHKPFTIRADADKENHENIDLSKYLQPTE